MYLTVNRNETKQERIASLPYQVLLNGRYGGFDELVERPQDIQIFLNRMKSKQLESSNFVVPNKYIFISNTFCLCSLNQFNFPLIRIYSGKQQGKTIVSSGKCLAFAIFILHFCV